MRQKGTVLKVEGERALVSVLRASACEGCHRAAEGCSACALLGGDKRHTALVQNPIGASVGERVVIEAPDAHILGYAALVYLLPVAFALLLYFVTLSFASEAISVLVFVGGFVLCALALFCVSALLARRKPPCVIVARLSEADDENSEFER